MNSNYFQSESVMPSDCTIQPTQQECMEYAQLTMQQEVAFVEVSSGQPAELYVEVSSGSPAVEGSPEWMSESECNAITPTTTASWSAVIPRGCFRHGNGNVYYNAGTSTTHPVNCGNNGYECIQKSSTAASYVTEAECSQVSDYVTYADWPGTASGCVFWGTPRTVYFNRNINTHECGYNSQWCIQKHSYYNFGHVEVIVGAAALEGDIRHVTEKECEVYAESQGLGDSFLVYPYSSDPQGCYHVGNDLNRIEYNSASTTIQCGNIRNARQYNCIQRDVITHHVAAEGCLSDNGKVRWNIPFLEVSSGSPATLGIVMPDGSPAVPGSPAYMSRADCEEYADIIGTSYNPNSESGRPKGCWHFTGSGSSNSVFYNTHATGSGTCTIDWSGYPQYCIQKSPSAAAYVSEEECALYANSEFYYPSNYGATSPEGCFLHSNGKVQFHTGDGADQCNSAGHKCIQKPTTKLPCAPHQCICKRGNVVTTTYQAGSRSEYLWEYGQVSSGSPAVEGSAEYVSESECQEYATLISASQYLPDTLSTINPPGCFVQTGWVHFNVDTGGNTCHSEYDAICIQKVTKTHKFIEVTTGMPATITYEEVTSGKPDESLSEAECLEYHNSRNGQGYYDNTNGAAFPRGCYIWGNGAARPTLYFGKTNEYGDCGHTYGNDIMICVQKSPDNRHVTELECEQYAVDSGVNWGGQTDLTSKPFACYVHSGSAYYNKYSLSTTPCSSSEICIQKAPFYGKSVQSIVKQAIDAVLNAEMHHADNTNLYIEDFEHPKTTENDILYEKGANFDTTSYLYVYNIAIPNNSDEPEEWRPKALHNSLEEAKAACSADSSNCLGVSHRVNNGIDLYFRHTGTSNDDLGTYTGATYNEYLYFHILKKPFFIRLTSDLFSQENLELLCNEFPSCFAYGNYVNSYDLEWSQSGSTGSANGNHIALFYKEFQLRQQNRVNAVYRTPHIEIVTSGPQDLSVSQAECEAFASMNEYDFSTYGGTAELAGCWMNTAFDAIHYTTVTVSSAAKACDASSRACVQKPKYVLVDSGAPDGSVSEAECLAIEGGAAWDRGAGMIKGCTKDNSGNIHFNTNTAANNNVPCGNNGVCIQKI